MTTQTLALTPQQRHEWDELGYFVVRGALSAADLAAITQATQEIETRMRSERNLTIDDTLEVRNAIVEHRALEQLLMYERTFPLVLDLMGGDIQLSTSHLIVRPPLPGDTPPTYKAIGWHADAPQAIAYDARPMAMKIGYFLSDVSRTGSGALLVVPGSHRKTALLRDEAGQIDESQGVEINALPGDAVFFHHRTFHSVGPNYSGRHRKVLYFGYNRRWLRPIDYLEMPSDLLARSSDLERQLLGETSNQCGHYLPKPDDQPLVHWLNQKRKNAVA